MPIDSSKIQSLLDKGLITQETAQEAMPSPQMLASEEVEQAAVSDEEEQNVTNIVSDSRKIANEGMKVVEKKSIEQYSVLSNPNFVQSLRDSENKDRVGFDKKTGRWFPHESIEQGFKKNKGKIVPKTLGYGILLDPRKFSKKQIDSWTKEGMSTQDMESISNQLLLEKENEVKRLAEISGIDWKQLPVGVKDALVEAGYQLGSKGLASFKNTLNSIKTGDFEDAALRAGKSDWAKQTPKRVEKFQKRLRGSIIKKDR